MNDNDHTWREVPGFPDYEVSDLGGLRYKAPPKPSPMGNRRSQTIVRGNNHPDGYCRRTLKRADGQMVDVLVRDLVLAAFVGPCPVGCKPMHRSPANHCDNRLSNVRYG